MLAGYTTNSCTCEFLSCMRDQSAGELRLGQRGIMSLQTFASILRSRCRITIDLEHSEDTQDIYRLVKVLEEAPKISLFSYSSAIQEDK